MSLEVKTGGKTMNIRMTGKKGNICTVNLDGKDYIVDISKVSDGAYHILYRGKSYSIRLSQGPDPKAFNAQLFHKTYEMVFIDAESRYMSHRKSADTDDSNVISSPMPGKVVRIPVNVGDEVKAGDTVIIVSAMKMESEYKVKQDRVIKEIKVKEGDTVDSNQPLVIIE